VKRIALCFSDDCNKKYNEITHGVEIKAKFTDWFCHQCNSALFWTTIDENTLWDDYSKESGKRKKTFRNEKLIRDHWT